MDSINLRDLVLPVKKKDKGRYNCYSLRVSAEYKERIQNLNRLNIDVAELLRPIVYSIIDAAMSKANKR